ncbi:Tubulin polyglutamylase ttll11 [Branchiostoma belcheri]|nr:Tubulin polyglutamylase ttll11 [Branchiostoma belcheri]
MAMMLSEGGVSDRRGGSDEAICVFIAVTSLLAGPKAEEDITNMSVKLQNMSDRLSAVQIHGHAIAVPDGRQHSPLPRARSKSPAVHGSRRVALTPISIPPRTRTPSPRARTHRTPSPRPLSATGSRPASAGQVDGGDPVGRAATLYPTSMFSFETFRRRDSGDTFRRIVVEESSR